MLKNRMLLCATIAAQFALAACGGDAAEDVPAEQQAPVEVPAEPMQVAPEVTEGAVIMDTSMVGTPADVAPEDTAAR